MKVELPEESQEMKDLRLALAKKQQECGDVQRALLVEQEKCRGTQSRLDRAEERVGRLIDAVVTLAEALG